MIANFFNKTKPVTIFSVVVLLFAYYLIAVFFGSSSEFSLVSLAKRMSFFFWYTLLLLLFNFIVKKNKLTKGNSYALLLVVFLVGTFSEAMFSNGIVFSNIMLFLAYRKIYSLRSGLNTKTKLFDAGFWIGTATLIYSWSIFYVILVYFAIAIYQKLTFKNLVIPIIGLITPILIYFTYCFYFDNLPIFYSRFIYATNLDFAPYHALKMSIPILFLISILVWCMFSVTPKIVSISNNFKFSWNVLLHHLVISVIIIFFSPIKNGSEMLFLIFPSAIIITNFLQKSKSSTFKNLLLYLFLLISISVYFL